jgi:hypothetical protein
MNTRKWTKGDKVVHAAKPEWGTGEILTAEGTTQDGQACQRLTLRFDRAGLKTLSTAFAELKPAAAVSPLLANAAVEVAEEESPALGGATPNELVEIMTKLPEAATDPFLSLKNRLVATLSLFKYGENPSLLLDWAAIQTGMKDPLSRFNRHELESYYSRFKIEVESHLRKLTRELRKQDLAALTELMNTGDSVSRQALRRADAMR